MHQATQTSVDERRVSTRRKGKNGEGSLLDALYHNIFVGIMRLLTRRRLGAAAVTHLLDEVQIQV